ncbi:PKD domain-containing protein [Veronia pacifica]|uniref:Uncharacterized protein n=1 Tax=Veronia pacifica TaxID=1080227 RepID=A0A1C3EAM6_9GAMM|nr:hypothetical protein [Veronia pacifica]ODA30283.1 hypothetical protein A8L45_20340 [Veronia pacifica]
MIILYKYFLAFGAVFIAFPSSAHYVFENSKKQFWWGGAFRNPEPCHTHQPPNSLHNYWAQFFRWHNHCTNLLPNADAGDRQTVQSNIEVILNGSKSTDSDGVIVGYHWRQVRGPWVKLSGSDKMLATFTAPDIQQQTMLVFRLKVQDDGQAENIDFVSILITPKSSFSKKK